jgi:hypothetical protein
MTLEEDEYIRDDFLTLMIKNTKKADEDDSNSDYNLSDDNSNSKSSAKLQQLQRKRLKRIAKEKREFTLKRRELKVYGTLSGIMIVIFVLYCLL